MQRIRVIAVGKIKESYVLEGMQEYLKRMKDKKIEIIEIKDSDKKTEGKEILDKLKKLEYFLMLVLDEHGKELTSVEFSQFIRKNSSRDLCFIIGGPDGLDKQVLDNADHTIALSKMTFTHEMARLILVEQLYRAFSIIDGKEYHRG